MSDAAFSVVVDIDAAGKRLGYVFDGPQIELTEDNTTRYFGYGLVSLELPELTIGAGATTNIVLADGTLWREALRGRPVHDATGRLIAVPPGASRVRDCVVMYEGVVNDLSFDANSELLSISVGSMELREEQAFPPASVGDYLRFPNTDYSNTTSRDLAVPIIYGVCHDVPLTILDDPETAGPWRYLIAGHAITDTSYAAGRVVDNDGAAVGGPYTVQTGIDGLGGLFSYITLTTPADIPADTAPPEQLYILIVNGKPRNGVPISGLGDVLEDMWLNYGPNKTPLDYSRTTQAKQYLNAFSIGARFDQLEEDTTMSQVLEGRFGAQFPVSFSLWGGKFGWDYVGRKQDRPPVGTIRYGQNTFSRGEIRTTSRASVVNSVEVEYQRSGRAAGTQEGYRLDQSNDLSCRASVSRWGQSRKARLSVPDASQSFSGDNNAAYLAASELIARSYDVFTRVDYLVVHMDALRWNLGDPVLVTDAEMGWDGARFYIVGKTPSVNGYVTVDLESADPFYARK